jgi:hypothetical protein
MSKELSSESFSKGALVLALIQALALWWLHQSIDSGAWPASAPGGLFAAYLVAVFLPLTLLVLWAHRHDRVLWVSGVAVAAFLAFTGYGSFGEISLEEDRIAGFLLPWAVAWLIALPMLRARLETGRWRTPYPVLFRSAWRSYLTLAESALFTGAFWLLLLLWAALFETLGNDFFKTVFSDPRFVYPATTLAFATATQIIGSSDRFIDGVLDQLLGLMKWLLPLAGLIVIAFSLALLPKLPALLGSGERVINSAVLLALVAVTLLLFNAAYREGNLDPGYGNWLQQALRVVPPLLVLIALTALYSMSVRLIELGLTPARYWGLVTAIFAVLYAVGYAYASLRAGPWLGAISRVNFGVSVILLTTLLVSLTPIADPLRLSVASQLKRALAASTADARASALRFLRFDSSEHGRNVLNAIVRGEISANQPANTAALRDEARRVAALESKKSPPKADPAATPARYAAWRSTLRVIPAETSIGPSLEAVIREEFSLSASLLDPGDNAPAPQIVFVDLDGDASPEALLWAGTLRGDPQRLRDYYVFRDSGGVWSRWSRGTWRGN